MNPQLYRTTENLFARNFFFFQVLPASFSQRVAELRAHPHSLSQSGAWATHPLREAVEARCFRGAAGRSARRRARCPTCCR